MNSRLAALDVHIDGIVKPPTLEQRLIAYVDGRDEHGKKNFQETLTLIQKSLEQSQQIAKLELELKISETKSIAVANGVAAAATEETRKADHAANESRQKIIDKKLDWLTLRVAIGMGLVMAAQAYIAYAIHAK